MKELPKALPLLLFLIPVAFGCTYEQLKEYSDKDINITEEQLEELAKEKAKIEYEKREPTASFCGNNVCEYYRLTLNEREGGGAIFLNNEFYRIRLDLIGSETTASICVNDKECGVAELNRAKTIGGIEVMAEKISYSKRFGESRATLTFGENSNTCATDCSGVSGYCGDNVCNAEKVVLKVGEEKAVVVDGALLKVKLVSLVKDKYWLELKGPDGMNFEMGGQGVSLGGVGKSIPRLRKGFNPVQLFITSSGGPGEMLLLNTAVTEVSEDSVTLFLGDEARSDPEVCQDCSQDIIFKST